MKRSLLLNKQGIQSPRHCISFFRNIPTTLLSFLLAAFSNYTHAQAPCSLDNSIQVQNVLCNSGSTGYIITNVSGGTGPYNYFWSNGTQSVNAWSLTAGTYIVTIVDYLGCMRKDTISVLQPDPIVLQLSSPEYSNGYNVSTYQGNDGSIDLTIAGGTAPFSYLWSNGTINEDPSGLTADVYIVAVTDSNSCNATGSIILDQPSLIEMPTGYSPNSDGANDYFVIHGIEGYDDNMLTIFNRWGNVVYQKKDYNNQWNGRNNKGEELPDGTYFAIFEINKEDIVLKGYVDMKRH
jgi:gliding motility-associated-like protein